MTIGSFEANGLLVACDALPLPATTRARAGDAPRLTGRDLRAPPAGLGMPAPSACKVLSGNLVLQVEQTGVGLQKTAGRPKQSERVSLELKEKGLPDALDKQTEQT